jgi:hypothetical protein
VLEREGPGDSVASRIWTHPAGGGVLPTLRWYPGLLLGVQGLIVALILFVVGKSLPLLGGAGASNFDSVQTRLALGNGQRLVWRWTPTLTAVAMVSLILWSGLK